MFTGRSGRTIVIRAGQCPPDALCRCFRETDRLCLWRGYLDHAKEGGTAHQLTRSPGEESWPRFSPDGKELAFSASYNGNMDIFVISSEGGVPNRITYNSFDYRVVEWHPDGQRLLFASKRESGRQSYSQFYLVARTGGMPEKLSVPYGELANFSPDGTQLAYITKITENYPFKRYRGGLSSDLLLFDMEGKQVKNLTTSHAIEGKPAWVGDQLFYLSDAGEHMRLNIWQYDLAVRSGRPKGQAGDLYGRL